MAELIKAFEPEVEAFTLIPSDGGRFELTVNGKLLYSKLQTNRHVEAGELPDLVRRFMESK